MSDEKKPRANSQEEALFQLSEIMGGAERRALEEVVAVEIVLEDPLREERLQAAKDDFFRPPLKIPAGETIH